MGAIANTKITLGTVVADDGTVTVAYPAGTDQDQLDGTTGGKVMVGQDGPYLDGVANNVDLTFGASVITITNRTGAAWPAGTEITASFGETDINGSYNLTNPKQVQDQVLDLEGRVAELEKET